MKLIKTIIDTYITFFPNLQYMSGMCDTYGMDAEYTQSYFPRMWRWITMKDTQYTVTYKDRGSQTS